MASSGAPRRREASVDQHAFGRVGLGSPATQLLRAVRQSLKAFVGRPDHIRSDRKTSGAKEMKSRSHNTSHKVGRTILLAKPLDATTWGDFLALFGKHRGVRGGCWCTYHRCTSTHYTQLGREGRREHQAALAREGMGYGLLFFDDTTPVAWCQIGPASGFPAFDRNKRYAENALPVRTMRPVWRITCLFVDKDRRGEGLSREVLAGALKFVREQGGGIVEAFPLEVAGVDKPQYSGTLRQYERAGFRKVAKIGVSTVLMRKRVVGKKTA